MMGDIIHEIGERKPISDINTSQGLYELLKLILSEDKVKDLLLDVCYMYEEEIASYYELEIKDKR